MKGTKGRTQLYLYGVLDTTWYYNDNWPVSHQDSEDHSQIYYIPHDTAQLFQSIRAKLTNYVSENAPRFVNVTNQEFLEIKIKRKFVTHYRNGDIDRELLLVHEKNLDGFWLKHGWQGSYESDIIFNHQFDTTLSWHNNRLTFLEAYELDTDIIIGYSGGMDADSIKIVKSIQKKLRDDQE